MTDNCIMCCFGHWAKMVPTVKSLKLFRISSYIIYYEIIPF